MRIIEVYWDGPLTREEAEGLKGGSDYGVYQVYGTHHVFGLDSLLYIGKAERRPFSVRIPEHLHWFEWESHPVSIYVGRLGGIEDFKESEWPEWEQQISDVERLLLYFCAPPYNSSGLKQLGSMPETILLNLRKKHRIPPELSTFLDRPQMQNPDWLPYGSDRPSNG